MHIMPINTNSSFTFNSKIEPTSFINGGLDKAVRMVTVRNSLSDTERAYKFYESLKKIENDTTIDYFKASIVDRYEIYHQRSLNTNHGTKKYNWTEMIDSDNPRSLALKDCVNFASELDPKNQGKIDDADNELFDKFKELKQLQAKMRSLNEEIRTQLLKSLRALQDDINKR